MDKLWICLALLRFFNIGDFQRWMNQYHKINIKKSEKQLYKGLHYILRSILKNLLDGIIEEKTLQIRGDRSSYYIGNFKSNIDENHGSIGRVSLNDIKHDDEKSKLLNKIRALIKPIFKSKKFDQLDRELKKFNDSIEIFYEILDNDLALIPETNPNNLKDYLKIAMINFLSWFHNIHRMTSPVSSLTHVLEGESDPKYMRLVFEGYKYGIQFLWSKLLAPEHFQAIKIKFLHKAEELFPEERPFPLEQVIIEQRFKNNESLNKTICQWKSFDKFYNIVHREIIKPLNSKFSFDSINWAMEDKIIFNKPIKDVRSKIITYFPEIIKKNEGGIIMINNFEELQKEFNYLPVRIMHTNYTDDFEGTPLLLRILLGYKEAERLYYSDYDKNEKIKVKRIIHPRADTRDHSYAVLIDGKGWIIFYSIGLNTGRSLYYVNLVEDLLERLMNQDLLILDTIQVDEMILIKNYSPETLKQYNLQQQGDLFLSYLKGVFFELVSYYVFNQIKDFSHIEWGEIINGKDDSRELDLILKTKEGLLRFIECKIDLHDKNVKEILETEKILQKIIEQDKKFQEKYDFFQDHNYSYEIWLWNSEVIEDYENKIKSNGNITLTYLKNTELYKSMSKNNKEKINFILDFTIDYFKNYIQD